MDTTMTEGRTGIETQAPIVARAAASSGEPKPDIIECDGVSLFYGQKQALFDISLRCKQNAVTAFIGPSGCGKSTLLRCLNRMNDLIDGVRIDGTILIHGKSIYERGVDVTQIRKRFGMVFQKSNPFPKSVYENVVYGLRIQGIKSKSVLDEACEKSLRNAALWDEVKDRLQDSALGLSGGQMQRICIARAIAVETHNMQQAARVSDATAFFMRGKLIEFDKTEMIFTKPRQKTTEDYITGRFG